MTNYDVSIVPCNTYGDDEVEKALISLLDPIGGLDWVKSGMRIAIKANLVTFAKPEEAVTTHPSLICTLVKILCEKGARVTVGDSPGGLYNAAFLNRVYSVCGLRAVEEAGGELNRDFGQTDANFPEARVLHSFTYTSYLDNCDAIINFCKLNIC